jgi:hypothetical protein
VTRSNRLFYLKFIAGVGLIEAYFAYSYSSVRDFASSTLVQVAELNTTAEIEPYYWFTLNTQREMFYNASKPITGGDSSFKVAFDSIYSMSVIASKFQTDHVINSGDLDQTYLDKFDSLMKYDLCPLQTYFPEDPVGSGLFPLCEKF